MKTPRPPKCLPSLSGVVLAVLAPVSLAACARPQPLPLDPGVTFQAHEVHDGLMIDACPTGEPTLASPGAWLNFGTVPTFVLTAKSGGREGVWLVGPAETVVRRGLSPTDPEIGRVSPSWDNNAVHLRIAPASGAAYLTGRFHREDVAAGTSLLSRNAALSIDIEGAYRAEVRALDGTPQGWLRVRIGVHEPAPVVYEGVLPPNLDEGLAAATAVALGDEINRIQRETIGARRASWQH